MFGKIGQVIPPFISFLLGRCLVLYRTPVWEVEAKTGGHRVPRSSWKLPRPRNRCGGVHSAAQKEFAFPGRKNFILA